MQKISDVATNPVVHEPALSTPSNDPPMLIQADELKAILGGVSDMFIWRRLKEGKLPKPLLISNRRFWRRDEIADYINRQSDARSATGVAA